jgi:hypothetical protein
LLPSIGSIFREQTASIHMIQCHINGAQNGSAVNLPKDSHEMSGPSKISKHLGINFIDYDFHTLKILILIIKMPVMKTLAHLYLKVL